LDYIVILVNCSDIRCMECVQHVRLYVDNLCVWTDRLCAEKNCCMEQKMVIGEQKNGREEGMKRTGKKRRTVEQTSRAE